MTAKPFTLLKIRDLVDAPPVKTVVRLDDATGNPKAVSSSFVFTSDVANHLHVLGKAFCDNTGQGYFLQGDFGSGKSHFLAVLTVLLEQHESAAPLASAHPALQTLIERKRKFLPVPVSLVNYRGSTSLERIITGAIENALAKAGIEAALSPMSLLRVRLQELLTEPSLAQAFTESTGKKTDTLSAWFREHESEAFAATARFLKAQKLGVPEALVDDRAAVFSKVMETSRNAGYDGVVLLIDELSEFFRSKPGASQLNEDARTLQFLGELSSQAPLWIIAAVQESIERTGDLASATFRKIKDRFPIKLQLSTLHLRDLISRRLIRKLDSSESDLKRVYDHLRDQFPSFSANYKLFRDTYPVHPSTLELLQGLGDLFSQHRGIVDFVHARIAGDEQRSINGILDRSATELLAPDSIYEHFSQRFLEISAFNIYPRHIVPHLDSCIEQVIEYPEDRVLAKRLIRILVLYAIHPAASAPTVRELTEMAGCTLGGTDPASNVQFVCGVILDPLCENSRFLTRTCPNSNQHDTVYSLSAQEDTAAILRGRIARVASEIDASDSRLLQMALAGIELSPAWPGKEILETPVERTIQWRQSTRRVLVAYVDQHSDLSDISQRIRTALSDTALDCCIIFFRGRQTLDIPHTAVWRIPDRAENPALREYLAAKLVAQALKPGNPADAPLISLVNDMIARGAPSAHAAALDLIYQGNFIDPIAIEDAAVRMKRFDRVLEMGAAHLLELRYPRFSSIAPRLIPATPRILQLLHEAFVVPGSLSLSDARGRGLTDALDSIATPLGLVEVKSGSYRLAPNPTENPFLSELFSHLSPSGQTSIAALTDRLRNGPYGAQADTVHFVLCALAHSGLLALSGNSRALPLEFIKPHTMHNVESVTPGELIGQSDREFLFASCPFLAPSGGFGSFGLRQQRDTWQIVVKLKKSLEQIISSIENGLHGAAEYSAFSSFDAERIRERVGLLQRLCDEIKVSYSPREGLERFLGAWRDLDLQAEDIERARSYARFFERSADQFIFLAGYLRHRSVETAQEREPDLALQYQSIMSMIAEPEKGIIADEGASLESAFERFRRSYSQLYLAEHRAFQEHLEPPQLARAARRALDILKLLACVRSLDRPQGLEKLLSSIEQPQAQKCTRLVHEELVRGASCSCGFCIGDEAPLPHIENPQGEIDRSLDNYASILSAANVVERIMAQSYAIRDVEPSLAKRLSEIAAALRRGITGGNLPDLLDSSAVAQIGRALDSATIVEDRNLSGLTSQLSGRRLTPVKIRDVFEKWLAQNRSDTVMAIESGVSEKRTEYGSETDVAAWWVRLRPDLFSASEHPFSSSLLDSQSAACRRQIPVQKLLPVFQELSVGRLSRFIAEEPIHLDAARAAWQILVLKTLDRQPGSCPDVPTASLFADPSEAALIARRLAVLQQLCQLDHAPFPHRLRSRLMLSEIYHDPWATDLLLQRVGSAVAAIELDGSAWLDSLKPVDKIESDKGVIIVVLDAMPVDVWLGALGSSGSLPPPDRSEWLRLTTTTSTVPSMQVILGMAADRDPVEELSDRGIRYYRFNGNESHPLPELLDPFEPGQTIVIRLGELDSAAHSGKSYLHDLSAITSRILSDHIKPLIDLCRRLDVSCVLTTDHGLQFKGGILSHGGDSLFERAVVRVWWEQD